MFSRHTERIIEEENLVIDFVNTRRINTSTSSKMFRFEGTLIFSSSAELLHSEHARLLNPNYLSAPSREPTDDS